MGCISSKTVKKGSPLPNSGSNRRRDGSDAAKNDPLVPSQDALGELDKVKEERIVKPSSRTHSRELKKLSSKKKGNLEKKAVFNLRIGRYVQAEQVAAGWPPWLSAVAGEAVEGWVPLRADLFEKLNKVGQGTYSSVYRARNVENGKIVALKKVRFDNFQPESVKFMSREISILRKLDHPNIVKLEGLITNKLSCSMCLVFEYMEHDLTGLLSSPDIRFTESQIKCYMQQLLDGIKHIHSRGFMHRDIKTSNILVNNEGVLKIADLGLANYISEGKRQELTSRVVTLWYRPPELLLGSTTYGPSVDMWSVGCVFAEFYMRKPILKGRTEVEQLHKIFKLCGSPPDAFWNRSKLPLATIFKPQHPYSSTLREKCRLLPKNAMNFLETFLSVEPDKRGTASTALDSDYFTSTPYACDPSSLPTYRPNKEIDAKIRDETRRRKAGAKARVSEISRRSPKPEEGQERNVASIHQESGSNPRPKGTNAARGSIDSSYGALYEASQETDKVPARSSRSGPLIAPSNGYVWTKQPSRNKPVLTKYYSQNFTRSQNMHGLEEENKEFSSDALLESVSDDSFEEVNRESRSQKRQSSRTDLFDASNLYDAPELPVDYNRKQGRLKLSGPMLPLPDRLDEGQDSYYLHKPNRRSRFYND